jgi:pimeloyl-ACP methyl ester carboxylesterase
MGPRIGRLVGAIVFAIVSAACSGASTPSSASPAPSAAASTGAAARDWVADVDIGGRTLSLACVGPTDSGRPTVIFEAGLGGDRGVWGDVMTALMATDRGCSYDRAGLGLSQPAPKPRTTDDQVDDLHQLLVAAKIEPPYVLVGHSSGGWNVMVYGGRYPDDVSGVVMVDVRPPAFSERSAAALPPEASDEPEAVHQARAEGDFERDPSANPEGLDLIESATEAGASPGFGDRPLVVLTAGDRAAVTEGLPAAIAEDLDSIWLELQTALAGLSTKGRQEIVPDATHDMPFEKPEVIVGAIKEVMAEVAG